MDKGKLEVKKEVKDKESTPASTSVKDKLKNKKKPILIGAVLIITALILLLIFLILVVPIRNANDTAVKLDNEHMTDSESGEIVVEASINSGSSINLRDATPSAEITEYFNYEIIFPFVRDGDIFLYKNGNEELIIQKPKEKRN
jgi:hypothetical protein